MLVVMAFVIVAFMVVIVAFVLMVMINARRFSRARLEVVLEGVRRTQRFAFQAHLAPIKLPL